jgi:hypothetical protein
MFVGYNNLHKGYKCLDVASRRVYIPRDVFFYETVFPFSEVNLNVGAQLKSEITLLHPTLIPSISPGGVVENHINDSHLPAKISVENTDVANDLEEESWHHM